MSPASTTTSASVPGILVGPNSRCRSLSMCRRIGARLATNLSLPMFQGIALADDLGREPAAGQDQRARFFHRTNHDAFGRPAGRVILRVGKRDEFFERE